MRVLKMKKNKIYLLSIILCSVLLFQCRALKSHKRKQILKQGKAIAEKYNSYEGKDTLFLKNGFVCIYKDKKINEYGKLAEKKKVGDWYYFDSSKELDKVENHKKDKHKIIYSRGLINQSW